MSELTYYDSPREPANDEGGTTQTRADRAGEPPAEPMSREEYADYMRQGPAADTGDERNVEYTGDSRDSPWSDPAEQSQGMTREEYADYMRQGPAAGADDSDFADAGTTGRPGSAHDDAPRTSPAGGARETGDLYLRVSAVQATPEDRTLGDTTPTGIGLKPTGDQLFGMEDDSRSYLEKLRSNIYERADDLSDAAEEYGGTLGNLFGHPPTETHTETPSAPKDVPNHQDHGIDGGHLATAGLVVGVLGFELARAIKNRLGRGRDGR